MKNTQATLSATFRKGTLYISDNSPNLGDLGNDSLLVEQLSNLGQQGWCVTRAIFEGFTLNLEMEKKHSNRRNHANFGLSLAFLPYITNIEL